MDEAGWVNKVFAFGVVAPILTVKHTAFVALSSESTDANNWFNLIIRIKDSTGANIFNTVRFEHTAAKQYTEKSIRNIDEYSRDVFNNVMDPKHKDEKMRKKWDIAYDAVGESKMNMVENYGVQTRNQSSVFDEESINSLLIPSNLGQATPSRCTKLILAIDPSYTGGNATALSIGYRDTSNLDRVYMWIDSSITKSSEEMSAFVVSSIAKFRETFTDFKEKTIVVHVETNSSAAGAYIKRCLEDRAVYGRVSPLEFYTTKLETGVIKTAPLTQHYITLTREMLAGKKVNFSRRLNCSNTVGIKSILNELRESALRYHYTNDTKKTCPTGKGKDGENDDLLITFMMVCYFSALT